MMEVAAVAAVHTRQAAARAKGPPEAAASASGPAGGLSEDGSASGPTTEPLPGASDPTSAPPAAISEPMQKRLRPAKRKRGRPQKGQASYVPSGVAAATLSPVPEEPEAELVAERDAPAVLEDATLLEAIGMAQQEDPFVAEEQWKHPGRGRPGAQRWRVDEVGLLRMNDRVYVPAPCRLEVKALCHDSPAAGHLGARRTLHRLAAQFYWDGMANDIKGYVRTCHVCQVVKPRHHRPYGELSPLPIPDRPF